MIKSYQLTKMEKKKIPLYLQLIALDYIQEPINRQTGINFHQWFMCSGGVGELILDGKRSIIHPGDGFFIAAHTPHIYKGIDGDFILNTIGFNGNIVQKLLMTLGISESGVYRCNNIDTYIDKVRQLENLARKELPDEKYVYSKALYDILLFLSQDVSHVEKSTIASSNTLINVVIEYLEQNYNRDIPLSELADLTGKTSEYLCKIFKKEMHETIVHFLIDIRISHARTLLCTYPEKSVAEISTLCGFQSPSYFGKIFKEIMKMSPNEYRARNM